MTHKKQLIGAKVHLVTSRAKEDGEKNERQGRRLPRDQDQSDCLIQNRCSSTVLSLARDTSSSLPANTPEGNLARRHS